MKVGSAVFMVGMHCDHVRDAAWLYLDLASARRPLNVGGLLRNEPPLTHGWRPALIHRKAHETTFCQA